MRRIIPADREAIDRSNVVDFRHAQIMAALRRHERAEAGSVDDLIWLLRKFGGPEWSGE
jgi:hypothetical protein